MKTLLLSFKNEKSLLLFLSCLYWITALIICWFSFDNILEFIIRTLPEISLTSYPKV